MTSSEPDNTDSTGDPYWRARRQLALAARQLNESLISADIPPEQALELSDELSRLAASLSDLPQVSGLMDMVGRRPQDGIDTIMGEFVAMAGRSHPCSPDLTWHAEAHQIRGTVTFSQAFEGPPGHVHGGWVAGILDHLMGMTHVHMGQPGMTSGLTVRYLKPTPLRQIIAISAVAEELDERRTQVNAEMRCGETITATATAIFIRVDRARFGIEAP
ncbi:PaaI family thioesterase [Luminiphilus sp.]|nr:PaaI family thioesterase [Luminiphilus sp.]MDA9681686.1 PaaI family thioesterase [Luminiphilus sp.]